MSRESHPNPPRLEREDDEAGRLLGRAAETFRSDIDETGAFRRLERARRRRAGIAWGLAATSLAVALALLAGRGRGPTRDDRFVAIPEPSSAGESIARGPAEVAPREASARAEKLRHTPSAVVAMLPVPPEVAPPTEAHCHELARNADPRRAVECFRSLSRGDGVKAEVALYEAARLSAERLGEHDRALELLSDHERRFPAGALRAEVDWLRVRSLRSARRFEEALAASELLLTKQAGRAIARDIHWLRGVVYQDELDDCEHAVSEYVSLVGEAGGRGDDAELRRARCLEELGRKLSARDAYLQYLKRPDAREEAFARTRLDALER